MSRVKNLIIRNIRAANTDQLRIQLTHLARENVDVIVATSAIETAVAKQVTSKIPIIFMPAIDPIGDGLCQSLDLAPMPISLYGAELYPGRRRQRQAARSF